MLEPELISGTSNLLNGIIGDTPGTDNIFPLEPMQSWNPGSGGPTLDVSALTSDVLPNLEGTLLQEETVQPAPVTATSDDIDTLTRESSTPVEFTVETGDRLFDAEYYAQINPDLNASGLNSLPQLFQHFKTHGLGEGRDFSLWTNLEHYAATNPDLEAAGLTLPEQIYQHLQTFGLAEGREFSPWVDLQYYLENNADLKAAFGEDTTKAFEHLQIFGLEEGRRFSPKLDLNYYLSHYSDLSAAFGDDKKRAFGHLQQFGVTEGRQFLPEIDQATTAESSDVESSEITEETQEGISIVFDSETTPFTSITTASDVEEEANSLGDLDELEEESETPASISDEVVVEETIFDTLNEGEEETISDTLNEGEEETISDTLDEGEEETISDTLDEGEEETISDTLDEGEVNEGTATASDDEAEAEQLSPTVTLSQTLMGLEEEPTPPLDLPENAGGANAKKNPAPKHLKLDATQEEYYKGGTVRLNGWIFDASGASDVERVEFSLHKTGEQWEEIENWMTFNISTKDDRWAYFDYSTFGLEPGKYQIKGFAYDSEGGKSNAAVAHFSVSTENPLPLVGVIDTGFNAKNGDIDYKRAALGSDYVDSDNNPLLEEGEGSEHGTHALGIIGATQKNGVGIYGINDQAPLWLSRAIGSGKWAEALTEFVDYAIASEQPTAIANLSLDLTQVESDGNIKTRYEFTPKEREALEYARQNGILVVVAAGNDGSVMSVLGQASQEFDNIITVGATNGNQRADYSSFGRRGPDIMAEGGSIASPILSTAGEDVGTMAGTSIAAAQVTGIASLVWEANPDLNYRQIIEALKSTATDLNVPGEDSETGAGLVNPDAAVAKAKQMTPEDYDPEDFLTPDTWGGEGVVTPEERAVADEFNGQYYDWVSYTIQSGDILSQIALDTMGDSSAAAYNFIAQHNGIANPDEIYAGATIEIPTQVSAPVTEPTNDTNEEWEPTGVVDLNPTPSEEWEPTGVVDLNPTPSEESYNPPSDSDLIASAISSVAQEYNLGNPTSDITPYLRDITYQVFENGSVVSSPNGTYPLYGGIRAQYLNTGGLEGYLGAPTRAEISRGDGTIIQYFENGHIFWNGSIATDYAEGEGIPSESVLSSEPSLIRTGGDSGSDSGKGDLIGGGIGSNNETWFENEFNYMEDRMEAGLLSEREILRYFYAKEIHDLILQYEQIYNVTQEELGVSHTGQIYSGTNYLALREQPLEFVEMWNLLFGANVLPRSSDGGYLDHYVIDKNTYHAGIDLSVGKWKWDEETEKNVMVGEKVYSLVRGKVVYVGTSNGQAGDLIDAPFDYYWGTIAVYNEQSKQTFLYLHMDSSTVKVGDEISAGTMIGISGNTGTGDHHLHLEVQQANSDPNPENKTFFVKQELEVRTDLIGLPQAARKGWTDVQNKTINPMRAFLEAKYYGLLANSSSKGFLI